MEPSVLTEALTSEPTQTELPGAQMPSGAAGVRPLETPPSWKLALRRGRDFLAGILCNRENAARAAFLLGPWLAYLMVEYLNNNDPFHSLYAGQIALNIVWYTLFFWVARLALGRKILAAAVTSGACFLFGLANHYVLVFRGRIIFPCDLLSLGTAANVAANYDYTPDKNVWIAAGILAGYWFLLALAHAAFHPRGRQRLHWGISVGSLAAIAVYIYAFFFTPLLPSIGIWAQQWKTQANGFLLNFMAALRYSFVSAPEGYSAERAREIADDVSRLPTVSSGLTPPENLIVVMNESFADMADAFPNLELSEDPLPFFHSLTDNTVRGAMISPVTGGGTANVEFEYWTGDALAFLPTNTVAYQLYCYDGMPSMVSQLKGLDYHTIAFHPYLSSGWNRTSVYPWMGFDEQFYEDDVVDPELIRNYVSDASDYRQLFRWTEETDGPTVIFNVTMQNHSGYAQGWNNLERAVEADGPNGVSSSTAAQYFSLIKESDNALRELIGYYQESGERTMVVFFGDHQPPLGNDFYKALYGKELDDRTTGEVFQEYEVPFLIWANYEIPEADGVTLSSNYLGALTAYLMGLELTPWQRFQLRMYTELPVVSTIGFQTADGSLTDSVEDLPESARTLYEQYRLLAYNHLFDEKRHPENFY